MIRPVHQQRSSDREFLSIQFLVNAGSI